MNKKFYKRKSGWNKLVTNILFSFVLTLFVLQSVMAVASFAVNSFSCTPSEVAINEVFSCTAQVKNNGDASGAVSVATLYPDSGNWLEESNYPQASGSSVSPGQSTEITFSGLRAIKSGSNGFSKIMLDDVTDTYIADNNIEENVINVIVTVSDSSSSKAMGGTWTSEAEVTAGGNIDVSLTFTVNGGGCSIGTQTNPKTISGMADGSKQSRTWTVTQGTTGNCRYTISAAATGIGGVASKTDSTSKTVTCTDCPVSSSSSSSSSSGGGGGGGGGIGTTTTSLGELPSKYTAELSSGENIGFDYAGTTHHLSVTNLTETTAVIVVESEQQTFTLTIGEEVNVDLNEDELAEISIQLQSINIITNKATFILTRLIEPVISTEAEKTTGSEESGVEEEKEFFSKRIFSVRFIIIFIIVFLIAVIIYFILMKEQRRRLFGY